MSGTRSEERRSFSIRRNDLQEQFLAGGLHHVATLEGPQAQLSPTHLVLPVIEQAAAQGIEIPVDI